MTEQNIRLYRGRDPSPRTGIWGFLERISPSRVYQAEFNPPLPGDDGELSRIISSDKIDLVLESLMTLAHQKMTRLHVTVEDSYWEPRIVITEPGQGEWLSDRVRFLVETYSKSKDIPLTLQGL
jgi:hypothetical protein